jgi:hypothetical protein
MRSHIDCRLFHIRDPPCSSPLPPLNRRLPPPAPYTQLAPNTGFSSIKRACIYLRRNAEMGTSRCKLGLANLCAPTYKKDANGIHVVVSIRALRPHAWRVHAAIDHALPSYRSCHASTVHAVLYPHLAGRHSRAVTCRIIIPTAHAPIRPANVCSSEAR